MKKTNLFEKFNKVFYALLILTAVSFTFTACDGDDDGGDDPAPTPTDSILDIVSESENHTQLEAFVTANSDLVSALGGSDLTLFAPNDAAFDALKDRLGVESLEQVDPATIEAVLKFHVATSVYLREDIDAETTIPTVQGESISFNANGNPVDGGTVTDVQYAGDEILATNGVVHVVETILIPPSIFDFIKTNLGFTSQTIFLGADFTVLAQAVLKADAYASDNDLPTLTSILANPTGNITVFAPVNAVFAQAGLTVDSYDGETWYGLISNHVVTSGKVLSSDIEAGDVYTSAAGLPLTVITTSAPTDPDNGILTGVALDSDGIPGAEAQVAVADIESNNGVVHAIAGVLLPPNIFRGYSMVNAFVIDFGSANGSTNYDFYFYSGSEVDPTTDDLPDGESVLYVWTEAEGTSWASGTFALGATSGNYIEEAELTLNYNTADETNTSAAQGSIDISYNESTGALGVNSSLAATTRLLIGTFQGSAQIYDSSKPEGKAIIENLKRQGLYRR